MKKLVLVLLVMMLATPVYAVRSTTGIKVDAPNLVGITKNLSLGVEGGKDVMTDVFTEELDYVEDDKGYWGYVKITYKGCILNCK